MGLLFSSSAVSYPATESGLAGGPPHPYHNHIPTLNRKIMPIQQSNLVYNVEINGVSVGLTRSYREACSWAASRKDARIYSFKDTAYYSG